MKQSEKIQHETKIKVQVKTLAGTGEQGRYIGSFFKDPRQASLNSPWDIVYCQKTLYIAMAGQHQIWLLNTQGIGLYSGSGREDIIDGPPHDAAFAQPSGLSLAQSLLYVVDAETSAIRCIDRQNASTTTLVGSGLFIFGDKTGKGTQARLQHPLDIVWDMQRQGLWIADTYNNKIKFFSCVTTEVSDLITIGLNEPNGLALYQNTLWIANTNEHGIVRYDLTQKTSTLLIPH